MVALKTRRVLAHAEGHVLVVNDTTGCCFDEKDGEPNPTYICRFINATDATAKWKGWLRSQAVVA